MRLKLEDAKRIIAAGLNHARRSSAEVTMCVCDGEGRLVALERMDGAISTSDRDAIGKAIASASTGRPSAQTPAPGDASRRCATVTGAGMPLIHRQGGLPIYREGRLIGGCGVGGADADALDEACAAVGVGTVHALQAS